MHRKCSSLTVRSGSGSGPSPCATSANFAPHAKEVSYPASSAQRASPRAPSRCSRPRTGSEACDASLQEQHEGPSRLCAPYVPNSGDSIPSAPCAAHGGKSLLRPFPGLRRRFALRPAGRRTARQVRVPEMRRELFPARPSILVSRAVRADVPQSALSEHHWQCGGRL